MSTRIEQSGPGRRWWLPVLLALVVLAILAGAFLATHPNVFGKSATATPKVIQITATPAPTPSPTAKPKPGPTGTPRPGPTGTPAPGPTPTPKPLPSPSPTPGVHIGAVSYPPGYGQTVQQGAKAGDPRYVYYLHPFQVLQHDLPKYGIVGTFTVVSPQPSPTPTAYTNSLGKAELKIVIQYQGKRYQVTLDQPQQQGPGGIWLITAINPAS